MAKSKKKVRKKVHKTAAKKRRAAEPRQTTETATFTAHFKPESATQKVKIKRMLRAAGLQPLMETASGGIVVRATRGAVEKLVAFKLKEKPISCGLNRVERTSIRRSYMGLESVEPPPLESNHLGRLIFTVPQTYWQPSAYPPEVTYYHLHPARDLPRLFGIEDLHAQGIRGQGVRVVMIDSGFFRHPYYEDPALHGGAVPQITTHGVDPTGDPEDDAVGHGTGIAANTIAIAPGCDFHHVKDDDDPVAAFAVARSLNPDVITCSWGWSESFVSEVFTFFPNSGQAAYFQDLQAEIDAALAAGTTVLFAAGNGPGAGSWPSSHPGAICVGGALVDEDLNLVASSYATSFASQVTPNRVCPDVCGLVGPAPNGLLFTLPTQPNNLFDGDFSAVDGTAPGDGWLIASGTSSATPQIAGIVALLLQIHGNLNPPEVQAMLENMAVGVHAGATATGAIATAARPNAATGHGFVSWRRPQRFDGYTGLL